jgi:hypothetical protein
MKQLLLFLAMVFLNLPGSSQFFIHMVLPMGVSGVLYGDTLLYSSDILRREGIRKIISHQTRPEITKTLSPITTYLSINGTVEAKVSCIPKSKDTDSSFCMKDTVLYDSKGRLMEFLSKDARGSTYMQCKVDYLSERKVRYTWIPKLPQNPNLDTSFNYHYYNEKGQLVRFEQESKKSVPVNASLYYGNDGLLDSITHDNPAWRTYVFKRRDKRNTKEIEMETDAAKFKWVYNSSGQCITSAWFKKNQFNYLQQSKRKHRADSESNYYYNANGTLSKVVEKRFGKEITTTFYSYTK